ncbi:MAG TPA: hypothetical protein DCQ83_09405 [Fibrobacteres bacterium]|jgi:hypothetical protein|nr:hypothetical protein [Fibrobacterota bacterium]
MTEAQFQDLINRMSSLTPEEMEALKAEIRRRLSPKSVTDFAKDTPKWWVRFRGMWIAFQEWWAGVSFGVAVFLWVIAIILIILALCEIFGTNLNFGAAPGPVCASTGEDKITRVADETAWGARRSHNAAVAAAEGYCATLAPVCTGSCASTTENPCKPGVHLINEEQFTVLSWTLIGTRTVLEYNCQCSCVK